MKNLLFLSIVFIKGAGIAAQTGIDLSYMSKHIENYKGRLHCAKGALRYGSDTAVCVRYALLEEYSKTYKLFAIGDQSFFSLNLSIDSLGMINEMIYWKNFEKKIKQSRVADSVKACFEQLIIFFNDYCHAEGKASIAVDDDYSLEKTVRWSLDRYQFILFPVNNRKKGQYSFMGVHVLSSN